MGNNTRLIFRVRNQSLRLPMLLAIFAVGALWIIRPAEAACTVPNQITNGQPADATAVMGNFDALEDCVDGAVSPTGTPVAGNLSVFSSSKTVTSGNLSGDCTTTGTLSITCTKSNGSSFGPLATGTDASNLTGTISVNRFNGGTNADPSTFLRGDGVWAVPSGGSGGPAVSWANGSGEKRLFVTATATGAYTGNPNVSLAGVPTNSFFWNASSAAQSLRWDFGTAVTVQGIGLVQDRTSTTTGSWSVEASNDLTTWTTLVSSFDWLAVNTNSLWITKVEFTNNTAYRYYRITKISGTPSGSPYYSWHIFKSSPIG